MSRSGTTPWTVGGSSHIWPFFKGFMAKFTIQETFSSSSMAFDGSLRPKESWRRHQNRILSHLFQLYVRICCDDHKKCLLFYYDVSKINSRPKKNILQTNNTGLHRKTTHRFNCSCFNHPSTWWLVSLSWWYRTDWFHSLCNEDCDCIATKNM